MGRFGQIAFTPSVKAAQEQMGSRDAYARLESGGTRPDVIGEAEAAFVSERDSFYLASVGENGWPYVQHRGGPKGLVRVLDDKTLGFADYRGNRQYISVGNVTSDDRVALIFVDYPNRARLKVLAHASLVTAAGAPEVLAKLAVPGHGARVERGFVLKVEAVDWNCAQHITPRFTEEEIREDLAPIFAQVEALKKENRELRACLALAGETAPLPTVFPQAKQ